MFTSGRPSGAGGWMSCSGLSTSSTRSPSDADAARAYGRVTAAVIAAGRKPRRRASDLMIAATAIAAGLPLDTTNPGDFAGLDHLVTVIPVTRPEVPSERHPGQ
jgi:hypothetical protein